MLRLKTRAQFQAVMAAGVCARTPHFVLHRLTLTPSSSADEAAAPPCQDTPGPGAMPQALFVIAGAAASSDAIWLGPLVPKRWARRSVTRHLLRRQVYAVASDFAAQLPGGSAYVVRLRAEFDRKHFVSASSEPLRQAVRGELQRLFGYALRQRSAGLPTVPSAPAQQETAP